MRQFRSMLILLIVVAVGSAGCAGQNKGNQHPNSLGPSEIPSQEDSVSSKWKLSDGTYLLEVVSVGRRRYYEVYDPVKQETNVIVGDASDSVMRSLTAEKLEFLSRSRIPAPVTVFPYLLVYDIKTRIVKEQDIFMDITQPVEFGKTGPDANEYLTLDSVDTSPNCLVLQFKEAGPFPATPKTLTRFIGESGQFVVDFPKLRADPQCIGPLRDVSPDNPLIKAVMIKAGDRGTTMQVALKQFKGVTYNIKEDHRSTTWTLTLQFSTTRPANYR